MSKRISALLALALAGGALSAQAATETLTYQGNGFDSVVDSSAAAFLPGKLPNAALGDTITASIVLSAPLVANGTFDLTPLSYTFSVDGNVVLSSTRGLGHPANNGTQFNFTTSDGVITAFDVGGAYNNSGSRQTTALVAVSSTSGDSYAAAVSGPGIFSALTEGLSSQPGQWTESGPSIAAPEMDPNSSLAALMLLAGGVLILSGRRSMVPRAGIEPAT